MGVCGGLGLKRWKGVGEGDKMMADMPFEVFGVRESRRASLGED